MSVLDWFVLLSTSSALLFAWIVFIFQVQRSKYEKPDLSEEEERLVELMGKVRIFVDSKIELLEKKLEEVRDVIKALNEKYIEFSALLLESEERIGRSISETVVAKTSETIHPVLTVKNESGNQKIMSSNVQAQKTTTETEKKALENVLEGDFNSVESESFEEKVYKLYLNGLEPVDIAKKLGAGVGEVMLVIDLLKRQEKR
ncbi:DUF6115 domain-containing protein [Fervidobacterium thailandense]|uniref:Uncharacterized protein n=1 Tax=Fervidobacterium thailandense TaxID=1008305 RepID=A0A1E3G519_9BACT|nr:hypothetical protein [Fervidobacterium thailandense]ODN31347.1 hypothetical protein A4H02_00870 [Fervidobacterium thailandense]